MGLVRTIFIVVLFVLFVLIPPPLTATEISETAKTVCISCHGGLKGPFGKPVALWKDSIHAQMGNSCHGCHGGDPDNVLKAMNPERGFVGVPNEDEIAAFCGKCHIGVKENYMKSAHYEAALKGYGPSCVSCHHSHDVQKVSFDMINEDLCSGCHSYENAKKIRQAFAEAEKELTQTEEVLNYLNNRGMKVDRLQKTLFSLRNSLHQMTHSLDIDSIRKTSQSVVQDIGKMQETIQSYQHRVHKRWIIGGLVALFLLILVMVLVQLLKSYEGQE